MRKLLAEKYRPKDLEGYVFSSKTSEATIRKWFKEKSIPNILLTGSPGTGKSTLARMILENFDVDPTDIKYVDASVIKAMDFIREELEPWLRKSGISDIKIVYFEEMDKLGSDAQKALRSLTENYSDRVRFIATANYVKAISPALISRFQHFTIEHLPQESIIDLICDIVEKEELQVNEAEDVLSHISAYQPDIRKILNSIDQHTNSEGFIAPVSDVGQSVDVDLWKVIWEAGEAVERFDELLEITEHVDNVNYTTFYEVMFNNHKNFPDIGNGLVLLSQYLDKASRSANQRLHLTAFLYHVFVVDSSE